MALPAVPALEGAAAGRCALALVEGLRGHGIDVTALAARAGHDHAEPPPRVGVRVVPVEESRSRVRVNVDRLRRPRGELSQTDFGVAVRASAAAADVLHLEQVEAGWLSEGVSTPTVVHLHHLVRADRDLGAPWSVGFREVLEFAAGERAAARRHNWLLVSSPVVRDALRIHAPAARIVEAPLSLLPEHYPAARLDGSPVLGIIGTGGWAPTARAVSRLVDRVWPLVRARVPEARLHVAGRGTASMPSVRPPPPGVDAIGEVDSAPAFLTGLSAMLFPLSRGSGMKVKVLEALACGLPVVTTRCGAEGLLSRDGIMVSEDDEVLASAAVELLTDDRSRIQRGDLARRHFQQHYSPAPATEPIAALYREMIGG